MWAGQDDTQKFKTRVLKPPGGGSSDIFGSAPEETSPRRVKHHNQSQLGSTLFGDAGSNSGAGGSDKAVRSSKPDTNPVTGATYDQLDNGTNMNGTVSPSSTSSGEKSSEASSPQGRAPPRNRVPPGGYSSGLW